MHVIFCRNHPLNLHRDVEKAEPVSPLLSPTSSTSSRASSTSPPHHFNFHSAPFGLPSQHQSHHFKFPVPPFSLPPQQQLQQALLLQQWLGHHQNRLLSHGTPAPPSSMDHRLYMNTGKTSRPKCQSVFARNLSSESPSARWYQQSDPKNM